MNQTEAIDTSGEESDNESIQYLSWLENPISIWSNSKRYNCAQDFRSNKTPKLKEFDVEIENRLWSLWGTIHPDSNVFGIISRGKQYLACCVLACCATQLLPVGEFTPELLDQIVLSGDRYHRKSLNCITQLNYKTSMDELKPTCELLNYTFKINTEYFISGHLFAPTIKHNANLNGALNLFFKDSMHGVLCWNKRCLTIGLVAEQDGGYFLFDCQSINGPMFPEKEDASYLLRTSDLRSLIYCIVITLDIMNNDEVFVLYKVGVQRNSTLQA